MCGICGLVDFNGGPIDPMVLERFRESIRHRGPDERGLAIRGNVGLGFRRLSIIDLSPNGHQPMSTDDRSCCLVFNGEIYNYQELRRVLRNRGHEFKSATDTEVILHAYEEFGIEGCLQCLQGMFAFALYDSGLQKLWLVRDRLGIKPLYYRRRNDSFQFCSELKGFTCIDRHITLNEEALPLLFTLGAVPPPLTIFKGIISLPPATYLEIDCRTGDITAHPYWSIPGDTESLPLPEWRGRIRDTFNKVIKRHLVSDVPLGAFLSGGIDSNLIVGLMSQLTGEPIQTFSIGFDLPRPIRSRYDELETKQEISRKWRINPHDYVLTEGEIADDLPAFIRALEQPSYDGINTYFVSKFTSQYVRVALSGLGGDELFGGYNVFYFLHAILQTERYPGLLQLLRWYARLRSPVWHKLMTKEWQKKTHSVAELYHRQGDIFHSTEFQQLFNFASSTAIIDLSASHENGVFDGGCRDDLNELSHHYVQGFLLNVLLRDTDVLSMAHSLEVRVPFLDHELVELVFRIPGSIKVKPFARKHLLTETFHDIFPRKHRHRRKLGFVFPLAVWGHEPRFGSLLREATDSSVVRKRGVLNPTFVNRLVEDYSADSSYDFKRFNRLWLCAVFELWCREYLDA
ncbi:asparagine synthase (glutamine-hydrolyzing) [Candidatus Poribacteria bacterium]|nr:asparagine synthase (glutamine-hydrolyzing) [Candidatus Poribacteria bacterium]